MSLCVTLGEFLFKYQIYFFRAQDIRTVSYIRTRICGLFLVMALMNVKLDLMAMLRTSHLPNAASLQKKLSFSLFLGLLPLQHAC